MAKTAVVSTLNAIDGAVASTSRTMSNGETDAFAQHTALNCRHLRLLRTIGTGRFGCSHEIDRGHVAGAGTGVPDTDPIQRAVRRREY